MAWKGGVIVPDGDSTPLNWSCDVFPCSHFSRVDESFPDEDATYVWTATNALTDTYDNQSLMSAAGTAPNNRMIKISYVNYNCRVRAFSITRPMPTIDFYSQFADPSSHSAFYMSTGYQTFNYNHSLIGTIGDNRPFTISDVDSIKFYIISGIGAKNTIRCTQCYVTVYWDYMRAPGFQRVCYTT